MDAKLDKTTKPTFVFERWALDRSFLRRRLLCVCAAGSKRDCDRCDQPRHSGKERHDSSWFDWWERSFGVDSTNWTTGHSQGYERKGAANSPRQNRGSFRGSL